MDHEIKDADLTVLGLRPWWGSSKQALTFGSLPLLSLINIICKPLHSNGTKRCGHLHAGENGTSTPRRRNWRFQTITVWTRLPTAHTSCKVWPWKGSRKQMRKTTGGERQTERERQNLIDRAQYPPPPFPPQFFVELRVSGLSWFLWTEEELLEEPAGAMDITLQAGLAKAPCCKAPQGKGRA